MHATIHLVAYWAVAFLSLGMAVVLLNIYFGFIGHDLELGSARKEVALAGLAALFEAASLWLILSFAPGALRAMIFPIVVVALLYKIAHFEDWSSYDVIMLMAFQIVLALVGVSLRYGHFQEAMILLAGFAFFLGVLASFARSLWG